MIISIRLAGAYPSEHLAKTHVKQFPSDRRSSISDCSSRPFSRLFVIVDNSKFFQFSNLTDGYLDIELSRNANERQEVDISLVNDHEEEKKLFLFDGIWIDKRAELFTVADKHHSKRGHHDTSQSPKMNNPLSPQNSRLEILSSLWEFSMRIPERNLNGTIVSLNSTFIHLLERLHFKNLHTTGLQLPFGTCITSKCTTPQSSPSIPHSTASEIYFKTKRKFPPHPNNTNHHQQQQQQQIPSAILLELGFWDFHLFLSNEANHNKAAIESFTSHFVTSMVDFILTLRRTIQLQPHLHSAPSVLEQAQAQAQEQKSDHNDADPSYAYNSLPSTTPIFLSSPALPPSYNPLLQALLHKALVTTVSRLRLEGDICTKLIDTSGWLDTADYANATLSSSSSSTGVVESETIRNANQQVVVTVPVPNAGGHRKMAYFLSVHLCPWLSRTDGEDGGIMDCAFQRKTGVYTGDLYVPDEVGLNMVIEERKIERAKMLVQSV